MKYFKYPCILFGFNENYVKQLTTHIFILVCNLNMFILVNLVEEKILEVLN